jgi:hypothetical protein
MKVTVGGTEYQIASLQLVDVRDLGQKGAMAKLRRFHLLEGWERLDVAAELTATAIRRAGGQITADELLTKLGATEGPVIVDLVPDILEASGFVGAKGDGPNAQSPGEVPTSTPIGSSGASAPPSE